ncbi:MAG: ABC transporter permease [Natronospirillum sp.]
MTVARATRWFTASPIISLIAIFLILTLIASLISPVFFSADNFQNIIRNMAVVGIIAMGMTAVLIAGEVDLSVGSVMAFAAMVGATLVDGDASTPVIAVTLLSGIFVGLVNGIGVAVFRVPSLIMTLGMLAIARALGNLVSGGQSTYPSNLAGYVFLGRGLWFGIPVAILMFAAVVLISYYVLRLSKLGPALYAVGANSKAATLSGISAIKVKLFAFVFSGFCAALAGIIQSARLGQINPAMGQGFELTAIAVAVLGGASLFGGKGTVEGTLTAALIFGVLYNMFNLIGISGHIQLVFVALIIVVMAYLHGLRERTA